MFFVDTHTHLYLPDFEGELEATVEQALDAGVKLMLLPNVDMETIAPMQAVCDAYPGHCLPMMGLHPCSVNADFEPALEQISQLLASNTYVAVGETGLDLYWDTTWFAQQVQSLHRHIAWSLQYDLPLVVHSRNSMPEVLKVLGEYRGSGLRGVLHCFPGTVEEALWAAEFGFLLGIGGVVTYKNSQMARVIEALPLQHIILETDAPYLSPVPFRGKRNQPAYIPLIAEYIAGITQRPVAEVAEITTRNALELFRLNSSSPLSSIT